MHLQIFDFFCSFKKKSHILSAYFPHFLLWLWIHLNMCSNFSLKYIPILFREDFYLSNKIAYFFEETLVFLISSNIGLDPLSNICSSLTNLHSNFGKISYVKKDSFFKWYVLNYYLFDNNLLWLKSFVAHVFVCFLSFFHFTLIPNPRVKTDKLSIILWQIKGNTSVFETGCIKPTFFRWAQAQVEKLFMSELEQRLGCKSQFSLDIQFILNLSSALLGF